MPVNKSSNIRVSIPGLKAGESPPKISMSPDPFTLMRNGPTIEIQIGITEDHAKYLEQNKIQIPQPISGRALIDTGASVSVVDVKRFKTLNVNPVGICKISTPQGTDIQEKYPAKISFPGTGLNNIQSVNVLGSPAIGDQGIIALIGRDIIRFWLLIYDGTTGDITIAS